MEIYFVTACKKAELEVIKKLKPPNILMSYFYVRTKKIKEILEYIGYKPKILLDSGAFSAWTQEKHFSIIDYMNFIKEHEGYFDEYIALDVVMDEELTKAYYDIMLMKGFNPIPVVHFNGTKYLDYYASKTDRIAIGGLAKERNKAKVRDFVNEIIHKYPDHKFHLLGSSSKQIIDHCNLYSCDSSTWIMMSAMGKPKEIRSKKERMILHMKKIMEDTA